MTSRDLSEGLHIEFYDALDRSKPPVLIGGGSGAQFAKAAKEREAINEAADLSESTAAMSPGSRHLIKSLSKIAGTEAAADEALVRYEEKVGRAREAFRERLANPDR